MTNAQMLALLVGTLLPTVIAIIQQPAWPSWARSVIAVIICLIVGFLTAFTGGALSGPDLFTNGLIVCVAALSTYEAFWKKTGIAGAIENATSSSSSRTLVGTVTDGTVTVTDPTVAPTDPGSAQ